MWVDQIKGCDGKSHHLNLDSELIYILFDKNLGELPLDLIILRRVGWNYDNSSKGLILFKYQEYPS